MLSSAKRHSSFVILNSSFVGGSGMPQGQLTLAPFYQGWEEYQRLLIAALAPLTAEQLAINASPGQRPIWQIVRHILLARIGWFARMGEGAGDPILAAIDLWDADGAPPRSADELVQGLAHTWAMIDTCLRRWTPAMLGDTFTYDRAGRPVTRTRQWIIWHVLEHDIHHGGEISLTLGNHGLAAPDL
jgi:uncharacterized damage-inducible protein DinB